MPRKRTYRITNGESHVCATSPLKEVMNGMQPKYGTWERTTPLIPNATGCWRNFDESSPYGNLLEEGKVHVS